VLQFLSFIIVLALLSGTIGLIVMTIRNASETVVSALRGTSAGCTTLVMLPRRIIRQSRPAKLYHAPLRAAA
jgi:hypothetical protein